MIPKTEPAENIPKSTPPPSMDTIVRDLRSLEKSFISGRERSKNELQTIKTRAIKLEFENSAYQSELDELKSKVIFLEDQNSKLKSDLEASELDKNLYYNQYQENGRMVRELEAELEAEYASFTNNITKLKKEVQELKLKNKFLKAEMKLLQTSELASEKPKPEKSNESNAPEWTRSKLSVDVENSDETSNEELNKKMQDSKRQQKRKSRSEAENENLPKSKKSCPAPVNRENFKKPKGNVIERILEHKFWPLPPPTFCAFEYKYLIKWKETKDGLAFDDTWECEEDIVKELDEFRKEKERKRTEEARRRTKKEK